MSGQEQEQEEQLVVVVIAYNTSGPHLSAPPYPHTDTEPWWVSPGGGEEVCQPWMVTGGRPRQRENRVVQDLGLGCRGNFFFTLVNKRMWWGRVGEIVFGTCLEGIYHNLPIVA